MNLKQRYNNDSGFRLLVNELYVLMREWDFELNDLEDAAIFAASQIAQRKTT